MDTTRNLFTFTRTVRVPTDLTEPAQCAKRNIAAGVMGLPELTSPQACGFLLLIGLSLKVGGLEMRSD